MFNTKPTTPYRRVLLAAMATLAAGANAQTPAQSPPVGPTPQYIGRDMQWLQPAWEIPQDHAAPDQMAPGYKRLFHRPWSTHVINTRMRSTTTITFPERIERAVVADPASFSARLWTSEAGAVIEVMPAAWNVDTTMRAYAPASADGANGTIYSFLLRAHAVEHPYTTDMIVDLHPGPAPGLASTRAQPGDGATDLAVHPGGGLGTVYPEPGAHATSAASGAQDARAPYGGYAETAALLRQLQSAPARYQPDRTGVWGNLSRADFDFGSLRCDARTVLANSERARDEIGPLRVCHDDRRTFVDYGNKHMERWPIPMRVTGDTESPIAFHTAGERRQILVIQSTGAISLRSGEHLVCIDPVDAEGHAQRAHSTQQIIARHERTVHAQNAPRFASSRAPLAPALSHAAPAPATPEHYRVTMTSPSADEHGAGALDALYARLTSRHPTLYSSAERPAPGTLSVHAHSLGAAQRLCSAASAEARAQCTLTRTNAEAP